MKTQLLATVFIVAVCSGCQSSNRLTSWMGHNKNENTASRDADTQPGNPGLPPPTNVNPRASQVSASSIDEHFQLGEAELNQGQFAQAQLHFEHVLSEAPQHAKANHRMGVVCDKLGRYSQAERHYQLALLNDPRNVAILSDLGYSYWLQGRHADSERLLLKARQVNPHYKTAVANLGMLYGSTGRQQEALAMFRQIGDEAAVQQIMQQVAAMSPPSATPAASATAMTPASLARHETSAPTNAARTDLSQVNEPTRELLELMEQGRRQQAIAKQARQAKLAAASMRQTQREVPQFVQNRPPARQGGPPQMAGVNPFHSQQIPNGARTTDPPRIHDQYLSQAIAAIDQQGRPTPPTGPLTIGPNHNNPQQTNQPRQPVGAPDPSQLTANLDTQRAGPQRQVPIYTGPSRSPQPESSMHANGATFSSQNTAPIMQPMDSQVPTHQQMPPMNPATSFEASPTGRPTNQQASSATITYGNARQNPSRPMSGYPTQPMGPPAGQQFVDTQQRGMPVSSGVQQASGFVQSPNGQAPIEHAHHQQQHGTSAQIDLMGGVSTAITPPPTGAPPTAGSQWPLIPSTNTDPNDPYQQARRQAAIMGLGAGPEQLFPYIQQTQRAAPGTNSRWNGAQYPPPERHLPNGMMPANLAPSFAAPQATNLTPGQNFQGQPLPQVSVPINTPTQFGAPASSSFQQYHQPVYAGPSANAITQPYEDVRQQTSQQLNRLINQTYGQPVQTPPSGIAALPSQTYNAPQGQPVMQSARPQAASYGQSTNTSPPTRWTPPQLTGPPTQTATAPQSGHAQPTGSTANQGIVIPEQYRPALNSGYQTSSSYQQTAPSGSSNQNSYPGPVIVPGR